MADDVTIPTEKEIGQLPRWARVAFAARCARRVLPLFQKHWPDAPAEHVTAIERAINVAEVAAGAAGAAGAAAWAARAAADAADAARATRAAAAVAWAANTAAWAADAGAAGAAGAATWAARAAASAAAIRGDFDHLLARARSEKWTDSTPVPPTVFSPLDPASPAAGGGQKPATLETAPKFVAQLHALAEPGVSAETLAHHLVAVYRAMNEYSLAKYGTALTRDRFRRLVYLHAGVPV